MEINQNKNELHLYPINNNEYMGSIDVKGSTVSNSIQTVVILDSSGSMGKETARFVKEILPLVMWKLNWNKGVDLISFSSKANWKYMTLSELRGSDIQSETSTCFGPAIRMFRLCLESIQQNYPGQPIRVLTVSDGAISDIQNAKDETKKLLEFLATTEMTINSQAVRLFTSTDVQPDTKALTYVLQINNTVATSLCDIVATSSNESIASSIADLFRSDCFANYQTLQFDKPIVLKFPWYADGKSRITMSPGWNIFWLKVLPTDGVVKLGNNTVKVIVESQLTLSKFHQLIETKLAYIMDHVAILKVVGTVEANRAVDQIFAYFKMTEDTLATNNSARNIKIMSNLLVGIAKKRISNDSAEMAEFLRSTKRETEIQLRRKKEADKAEQLKREEEERLRKEEEQKKLAEEKLKREEELLKIREREESLRREEERRRMEELQRKKRDEEERERERERERLVELERAAEMERKKREEEMERKKRLEEMERKKRLEEMERKEREAEMERKEREAEMERKKRLEEMEREERKAEMERRWREEELKQIELSERQKREEDLRVERMKREEEERLRREQMKREEEERLRREQIKREEEERLMKEEERKKLAEEELQKKEEERVQQRMEEEKLQRQQQKIKEEREKHAQEMKLRLQLLDEQKKQEEKRQQEMEEERARIDDMKKRHREEELLAQRQKQEQEEKLRLQLLDEQKKLETGLLFAQEAIQKRDLQPHNILDGNQSTDLQHINEKQKHDFANQAVRGIEDIAGNFPDSRKKSSLITTAANKVRKFTSTLRSGRNNNSPNTNPMQTVFILHENVFVPKKHCRFAEKIVPLMFSKISNDNSQLVHLLTVASDKTPVVQMLQSILQTLDANKPIRITVLTDMTSREQQQFDNFAEALIKFLSGSNFTFELQVVRIGSECEEKLVGGANVSRKYRLIDIDTKKSNVWIAAQIVELFHSNNFHNYEHDNPATIDKSSEAGAPQTDVMSLDVDGGKQFDDVINGNNCQSCRANNQRRERKYSLIYLAIFAIPIVLLLFDIFIYTLKK